MQKKFLNLVFVLMLLFSGVSRVVYADGRAGAARDTTNVDTEIFPGEASGTTNNSSTPTVSPSASPAANSGATPSASPSTQSNVTEASSNVEGEVTNVSERNGVIRYVIRTSDSSSVAVYAPSELGLTADSFKVGDYVNFTYDTGDRSNGYFKLSKLEASTQANHSFGTQATAPEGDLLMNTQEPTPTPTVTPQPEGTNEQIINTQTQVQQETAQRNNTVKTIATALGIGTSVALLGAALVFFVRNKSKFIPSDSGYYDDYD